MNIFRTRTFAWWEMGLIKMCLLSLGILLGIYFLDIVEGLVWLWVVLFVVPAVYFIIRFFREG